MNNVQYIFSTIAISLLFMSCEKVIDLNIKDSEPALVIVGNINDQPGPYIVTITRSVNFSSNNTFPSVDNALVILSDNAGNTDTLSGVGSGTYKTNTITGISGRAYILSVMVDGETYIASSQMPIAVPFDSLVIEEQTAFGDPVRFPKVIYTDPADQENYYRFIEFLNGKKVAANFVRSDRFSNGNKIEALLRDFDSELSDGDSVYVEMQSISKSAYDYFNTLNNVDGNTQSAAPANPLSNFSNGALGYFNAHTSQGRSVVN